MPPKKNTEQQGSKQPVRPDKHVLEKLGDEISDFAQSIGMTEEDRIPYGTVIEKFRQSCKIVDDTCKIIVMGSYASDIIMKNGDVDIFVKTCSGTFLQQLHKQLSTEDYVKSSQMIRARVPVCRFRTNSGIHFDINIADDGSGNARYVRDFVGQYPQMKPLCFVLKTMIKNHGMGSGRSGGVPGIALHYLVVSHLQNYELHFGQDINAVSLGQLLYDFLYLYAHQFDFQANVICVGTGNYERRKSGDNVYFRDPTGDPRDVLPGSTSSITLIKKKFAVLFKVLQKNLEGTNNFLEGIVTSNI
jgi:DNA polymerase sigma